MIIFYCSFAIFYIAAKLFKTFSGKWVYGNGVRERGVDVKKFFANSSA